MMKGRLNGRHFILHLSAFALRFGPVAQLDSERRLAEPEVARSSRAGFA